MLGWCRTFDREGFDRRWFDPAAGCSAPLVPAEAGSPLDLHGLTDESLLRHFVATVDCTAAVLAYVDEEHAEPVFARWLDSSSGKWARSTYARERLRCTVWPNYSQPEGCFSAGTYASFIAGFRAEQRQLLDERTAAGILSPDQALRLDRPQGGNPEVE